MITYLLDTNTCIYILKKRPQEVFDKFRTLNPENIGISSITAAELSFGVNKSSSPEKNQKAIDDFLTPLQILDFDQGAAKHYGLIRANLEKNGTPIGPLDTLIAAHAKSLNAVLITNNLKEFIRVEGLVTENWINAAG